MTPSEPGSASPPWCDQSDEDQTHAEPDHMQRSGPAFETPDFGHQNARAPSAQCQPHRDEVAASTGQTASRALTPMQSGVELKVIPKTPTNQGVHT